VRANAELMLASSQDQLAENLRRRWALLILGSPCELRPVGRIFSGRETRTSPNIDLHRPNFVDLFDALILGSRLQSKHNIFTESAPQLLVWKLKLRERRTQEISGRAVVETNDRNLAPSFKSCIVEFVIESQCHVTLNKQDRILYWREHCDPSWQLRGQLALVSKIWSIEIATG
jgi:hypothetical protein